MCFEWVENGVVGFGWVWDKVVGVEVFDEAGEICLGELLEVLYGFGCDDQRGVVGVGVAF